MPHASETGPLRGHEVGTTSAVVGRGVQGGRCSVVGQPPRLSWCCSCRAGIRPATHRRDERGCDASWHIHHGPADGMDLSDLRTVMSLRYFDRLQPSTPWEVVLNVDQGADAAQRAAIADIFLGRAGGTVARLYGPAIGEVLAVRPARITVEHTAPRKRIGVVGYLGVDAEGRPPSQATSSAASPASTTPAPSSTATHCSPPTPRCAALGDSRTPQRRLHHRLRLPLRHLRTGPTTRGTRRCAPTRQRTQARRYVPGSLLVSLSRRCRNTGPSPRSRSRR